jgi:hypothetical protein
VPRTHPARFHQNQAIQSPCQRDVKGHLLKLCPATRPRMLRCAVLPAWPSSGSTADLTNPREANTGAVYLTAPVHAYRAALEFSRRVRPDYRHTGLAAVGRGVRKPLTLLGRAGLEPATYGFANDRSRHYLLIPIFCCATRRLAAHSSRPTPENSGRFRVVGVGVWRSRKRTGPRHGLLVAPQSRLTLISPVSGLQWSTHSRSTEHLG